MASQLALVSKLGKIASTLSSISDLTALVKSVSAIVDEIVSVEYTGLYFADPETQILKVYEGKGFTEEELGEAERTAMDRHPGWVYKNQQMLHISDTHKNSFGDSKDSKRSFTVRSRLWLPVVSLEGAVGAFGMASTQVDYFSEEHIAVLTFVCNLAGVVYENIRLTQEREKNEQILREALAEANKAREMKQNFLAKMSHEIRTPMNAIIGMTDLLRQTLLDQEQSSFLYAISVSSTTLLELLNDILDFSKMEAEQFVLEHIPFDLKKVMHESYESMRFKAAEKGIEFEILMNPNLPDAVLGDSHRLAQVFLNLVNNALKFTSKGSVRLAATCLDETDTTCKIRFEVSDTGIGVKKEQQALIFESFQQEDESTTRRFGGSGLGLSIVKEIVDLYNGKIWLESEKGEGATFLFEITFEKANAGALQPAEVKSQAHSAESLEGLHVLVVEDNEINQFLALTILERSQADVEVAENGLIALDMLKADNFDCVLMDMQMPVMDGLEATRVIRDSLHSDVPIIALTANAIDGDEERCLEAGMNDYIAKPFQAEVLVKKILDLVSVS